MRRQTSIIPILLLAPALFAGDPAPVVVPRGPEFFLVPGDTSTGARAAIDDEGNFVGLFFNQFGGFVEARGGTLDGLLPPFFFGGGARRAGLAATGDGEFVISWSQLQGYRGPLVEDVFLRRYEVDGTPIGSQVAVSDLPTGTVGASTAIAMRPESFLVAWEHWTQAPSDIDIRGRVVPFAGSPAPSFPVNSWTTGKQSDPRLATAPDGSALVVWRASDCTPEDPSGGCVRARYLDASGVPPGPDFMINSETSGTQIRPDVATSGDGFVVVWRSADCGAECIRGRLVSAAGVPLGADFRVDEPGADFVDSPGIGVEAGGNFVVTWKRSVASDALAFGRAFDGTATPLTGEFQVNSDPSSEPYETDVAINAAGNFVVVWSDAYNLWGRLFDLNSEIFADGFESGDTTAWSTTVP
jgi:hypothetical protein